MKQSRVILLLIAIFICVASIPVLRVQAQENPPTITTDRPIYPLWRIGGKINVTVTQLVANKTYFLWFQRPTDAASRVLGRGFPAINGTRIQVSISPSDPSGTYLVSLSTSNSRDTREAVAHFGMFGTGKDNYERNQEILITGGGFAPNSTISIALRSGTQVVAGFPVNVDAGAKGDFSFTFKTLPSTNVGILTATATGTAFDTGQSVSVSASIAVKPTSVIVSTLSGPMRQVERTAEASVTYQLSYADGSPVSTMSSNSTMVSIMSVPGKKVIEEVPLEPSDPATGKWKVAWVPPVSTNLTEYYFELAPASFDDSYGNIGRGAPVRSDPFDVVAANLAPVFQMNSTLQRTQEADVVIFVKYHDGSNFGDVAQTTGSIMGAKTTDPLALTFNATLNEFTGHFKVPVNADLGFWRIIVNIRDAYGNTASGDFRVQIIRAELKFAVDYPAQVERTTMISANATMTYPDDTIVTPTELLSGLNMTVSLGNFTLEVPLGFDAATGYWSGGWAVPENATLGEYSIALSPVDTYENAGTFTAISDVIPARFRFLLVQTSSKASPLTPVNIPVYVSYPNGSALTNAFGEVTASYTNSSGTFNFPLIFNSTDLSWHLLFLTPNLGLTFGATITFSFDAKDVFGNAGSLSKAYDLNVGAGTQTLILTALIGAIPPVALLSWAIITISGRKRKHKP